MSSKLKMVLAGLSVGLLTGCDLATKALAKTHLQFSRPWTIVPGFWDMKYTENRDVGFSLLSPIPPHIRQPLIFVMVLCGLVAVLLYGIRRREHPVALIGVVLIVSGALGNLIDRAMYGYVTDFVHWFVGRFSWPVFNVADVCVVIGVALVMLHEWRAEIVEPASPQQLKHGS